MKIAVDRGMLPEKTDQSTYLSNWETMEAILDDQSDKLQTEIDELRQVLDEFFHLTEALEQAGACNPKQATRQLTGWLTRKLESAVILFKACKNAVRVMRVHGTANMGFAIDECETAIREWEQA